MHLMSITICYCMRNIAVVIILPVSPLIRVADTGRDFNHKKNP